MKSRFTTTLLAGAAVAALLLTATPTAAFASELEEPLATFSEDTTPPAQETAALQDTEAPTQPAPQQVDAAPPATEDEPASESLIETEGELILVIPTSPTVDESSYTGAKVLLPATEGVNYVVSSAMSSAREGMIYYYFEVTATPMEGYIFDFGEPFVVFTFQGEYESTISLIRLQLPPRPEVKGYDDEDVIFPNIVGVTWMIENRETFYPDGEKVRIFKVLATADSNYIFENGQKELTFYLTYERQRIELAEPTMSFVDESITPDGRLTVTAYLHLTPDENVRYRVSDGWEQSETEGVYTKTLSRDYRLGLSFPVSVYIEIQDGFYVKGLTIDPYTGHVSLPLFGRYEAFICPEDENGPVRLPSDGGDCSIDEPEVPEAPTPEKPETSPSSSKIPEAPSLEGGAEGDSWKRKFTYVPTTTPETVMGGDSSDDKLVTTGSDSLLLAAGGGLMTLAGGAALLAHMLRRRVGADAV